MPIMILINQYKLLRIFNKIKTIFNSFVSQLKDIYYFYLNLN